MPPPPGRSTTGAAARGQKQGQERGGTGENRVEWVRGEGELFTLGNQTGTSPRK